jgi:putative ABC transport system permease protein
MPYLQDRTNHVFAALYWYVRSTNEPRALSGNLRSIVYDLRHNQPIDRMQTMDEAVFRTLAPRRLVLSLFGSFASLALLLSAVGIFGMIAYSASLRIPEIGVRIALGAQRSEVRRLILKEGMLLTGIGILLGAAIAAMVTRAMSALLFSVRPGDPISFVSGAAIILVVAAAACAVPAWRAGSVDPMRALRTE